MCRIVPFHKKVVRHRIGRSVIINNRSIISTFPFITEKNLTVIKEKISIIHEKTSITAGEMSFIRHPLRSGRPRTRKRRHPAIPGLNVSIDEPLNVKTAASCRLFACGGA
ncbi:hypothetical protein B4135_0641 [Caldibacillus debilis]|uniref:Uncharacterized protein n=1 Tax=Caldibacillus debilis TaxID=301148 RepID=A0A150MFP8_9BACI|nr:hypothetical protein B4135_0641 [Caldibacillus debilis]